MKGVGGSHGRNVTCRNAMGLQRSIGCRGTESAVGRAQFGCGGHGGASLNVLVETRQGHQLKELTDESKAKFFARGTSFIGYTRP